jgi:type I restriction enzyme, S subunit
MDAQQFLAEFGHIANAPGGVGRLREMILALAASGDLVTTKDQISAIPLLLSIEKQKRQHKDQKKVVPKQAAISEAQSKAPAHWALCRLGDLTLTITGGGTPSKNNPKYWAGNIPWASVKDLKDLKYLSDTADHISIDGLTSSSSNLIPANRVIVCTRMGLGKIVINTVALAINQDLKALELPAEVNQDFFFILYKTRELKGTGTTVAGIKQDQLLALPAALPPTEEQLLIVAKVDELMALCDRLEGQQQQRHSLQNNLRQSALQAVAAAMSPHELQTTWTRLADNFSQLFDAPEDVAVFKGLILDLAVSGQLLNIESRSTSTATELLLAISAARVAWSKECEGQEQKEALAMLKKLRTQQVVTPDAVLPDHWAWASLLQVSQAVVDCHNKTAPYVSSGIHLIRTTDIRNGRMELANTRKISEETYAYWARRMPPRAGDIFFTREAPMGEAAIVPEGEKGLSRSTLDADSFVSEVV